ncbi:DUF222 domain-containing protein [Kytococcus sp. Marseille-QA3725]
MTVERRAVVCLEALHREIDGLLEAVSCLGTDGRQVSAGHLRELDQEVYRARNRLESARLRLGEVTRREREAGRARHLDEGQFFGSGGRMDPRAASRAGRLAAELGNAPPASEAAASDGAGSCGSAAAGEGAPPVRSVTGLALDDGTISPDHARAVTESLRDLPDWVESDDRARIEEELVRKARRMTPREVRSAGRRALDALPVPREVVDAHEDSVVQAEEAAAHEAAFFTIHHGQDGLSHGRFSVPELQGRLLEKVLASLTGPRRRNRPDASPGPVAREEGALDPRERARERAAARGRALCEVIDHLPTDRLGGRTAFTFIVSTDLATLRGEADRAGATDVGVPMSAGQVRRLAAQAGIVPTVMGGESLPLDLGTQRRFFTESQRMALAHLYSECAAEDCDRPFAWTEMHHVAAWSGPRGGAGASGGGGDPGVVGAGARGRTDLANAVPLCGRHNRMIEDSRFTHTIMRDGQGRATVHLQEATGDGGPSPTPPPQVPHDGGPPSQPEVPRGRGG